MECIRDTGFGHLVRVFTRRRALRYADEVDPTVGHTFVHKATASNVVEPSTVGEVLMTVRSQASELHRQNCQALSPSRLDLEKPNHTNHENKVIGWTEGPDSENPQNWSLGKKWFVSTQINLLTFVIYLGSAIYSPGAPGVAERYGVSEVAAVLGLTIYVAGYGVGPMLWSPLSEIPRIGRSPTYVLTLFVFIWFNFGVIYAPNFGCFLAFRFLTGFFGSPALATGAASMTDMWDARVRDYMITIWGTFTVAAPVLGPSIGGFAAAAKGWQWTIWPLLWSSAIVFVLLFFCLPETYAPNILERRAARVRKITGENYQTQAAVEIQELRAKDLVYEALVRPFQLCFGEPIVLIMNLWIALIYGIQYIFFEAFPIVFQELHGFNAGEQGLTFISILVSVCLIAVPGYFVWKSLYQTPRMDANGDLAPEKQLPAACFGALLLPISLFWFGWSGNFASVHWIVPTLAAGLFGIGGCTIFNSIFTYQTQAYPKYAASVLAGNDLMRSSFGAGFPLFATAMFRNLGIGWASSLLAFLTLCFVPFPFILLSKGKAIRMRSKFARHDI